MESFAKKFLSRKFVLGAAALGVTSAALFLGYMNTSQWLGAVGTILGLYHGANVIQKLGGRQ